MANKTGTAIFAAGCFWGVQDYFDQVAGVVETTVGYTGGTVHNPTYVQVCSRKTGHAEAIKIDFDPKNINYQTLLKHFFRLHDPTQYMRQGADTGPQYRSAIFFVNDSQKKQAEDYVKQLEDKKAYKNPIVTEVTKASEFYPAEKYHQKFVARTGRGACHVAYKPL